MANRNPKAEKLEASATFSTSSGSTGDVGAISAQINDFARAYAQVYPGATAGTADVPYGEVAALLGQMQANALKQANSKFQARIEGSAGSVSFSGFEIEPNLQISPGSFTPQIHAVHDTATLQRLSMSLYRAGATDVTALDAAELKSANIIERMIFILEQLVTIWRTQHFPVLTGGDKRYAAVVHEMNIEPLKILHRILSSSSSFEIPGLAQLANKLDSVNSSVNNWLMAGMTSNTVNFWDDFLGLVSQLGLLYAPAFGSDAANGRLFSPRDAFAAVETKDDLDSVQFQPSLRLAEVPVTYVIMTQLPFTSLNRTYAPQQTLLPGQVVSTTLKYPEGQVSGRAHVVAQPPFLNLAGASYNRKPVWGVDLTLNRARTEATNLADAHVEQTDALKKFLTGYLRNTLHTLQLQGSGVNITTALNDMSWEIGRAYAIQQGGKAMFRGILASCTHNVSSIPGGPQAMTALGFSYVQWGGFSLPFT